MVQDRAILAMADQ